MTLANLDCSQHNGINVIFHYNPRGGGKDYYTVFVLENHLYRSKTHEVYFEDYCDFVGDLLYSLRVGPAVFEN